jgi:hypothetical protein
VPLAHGRHDLDRLDQGPVGNCGPFPAVRLLCDVIEGDADVANRVAGGVAQCCSQSLTGCMAFVTWSQANQAVTSEAWARRLPTAACLRCSRDSPSSLACNSRTDRACFAPVPLLRRRRLRPVAQPPQKAESTITQDLAPEQGRPEYHEKHRHLDGGEDLADHGVEHREADGRRQRPGAHGHQVPPALVPGRRPVR